MGDILSQSEIDNLLNALTSGDTSSIKLEKDKKENELKPYDFAHPQKFSKEQLRTFEIIFDNYCRLLSSFLTGYLRTTVQAEVLNSEQITYNNFTNSLSNPTILGIVDFEPFKGSIIIELSTNIGYAIIDRVLGGPGYPMSDLRDLSDIEKILLERVFVQLLRLMPESWENLALITPRLDTLETNIQFAQVLAPNEQTALITLEINIGGAKGYFNFCIPYIVIEPIAQNINTANWFRSKKTDMSDENDQYIEMVERKIERAFVDISAIIGQTSITVGDFVNLSEGDIILLDTYINSELDVKVGELLKFTAKPGISRGKIAIQIMSLAGRRE